jgi:hypothetical protein
LIFTADNAGCHFREMTEMPSRKWNLGALITTAALVAAWGCETKTVLAPPMGPEAKVTGKVTIRGKPAAKGQVTLELTNDFSGKSRKVADVKADGTFEVSAVSGKNSVTVAGTGVASAEGGYNSTTFEVKTGETNKIDIDLPLSQAK